MATAKYFQDELNDIVISLMNLLKMLDTIEDIEKDKEKVSNIKLLLKNITDKVYELINKANARKAELENEIIHLEREIERHCKDVTTGGFSGLALPSRLVF